MKRGDADEPVCYSSYRLQRRLGLLSLLHLLQLPTCGSLHFVKHSLIARNWNSAVPGSGPSTQLSDMSETRDFDISEVRLVDLQITA
jgi:hypothetical protein